MKRKLTLLLLCIFTALCCAVSLTACGLFGDGTADSGSSTSNTQSNPANKYVQTELEEMLAPFKYEVEDDGTYTITGIQDKNVTTITIPDCIVSIEEGAFDSCTLLTSITIPDSVTSIESGAFNNCTSLTSITVDEENENYKSIDGNLYSKSGATLVQYAIGKTETSFTIPDSVTSIKRNAFDGCANLIQTESGVQYVDKWAVGCDTSVTNVILRSDTKGIADYAFDDCKSLISITISDSVTYIGDSAFYFLYNLENVYYSGAIADWCGITFNSGPYSNPMCYASCFFMKDSSGEWNEVTEIVIPDTVTTIGSYQFYGFENVTSITIPDSVETILICAFNGCTNLIQTENGVQYVDKWVIDCENSVTNVTLRSDTKGIANSAFSGCELKKIIIPNSVTNIGGGAFFCCTSLTSITIPDSVTSIGNYAFFCCTSLTSITIPDSVTSIGGSAFYGCFKLTSITVPDSVTSIGDAAFLDCTSLTSVKISNGVTSIGLGAFNGCTSLTSIAIPNSVTSIGLGAFYGCTSLTSVTLEKTSGWWYASSDSATSGTNLESSDLSNASTAAKYLTSEDYYSGYYWKRS